MYRRRSTRARSSNFRRRPRTHEPKRSGHWQRGNIALFPELTVDTSADAQITTLILAQIFRNLGGDSDVQGKSYGNQVKFLEIGGIVFDWRMIFTSSRGSTAAFDNENVVGQILLVSDRLDADGNPAAVTSNWFTNTTPTGVAEGTETQDEDHKFPTRVHYRAARAADFNDLVLSPAGDHLPANRSTFSAQGSKSLRLRTRYDDEHCLSLVLHLATDNTFPSENVQVTMKTMFVGSLYYRVVF